CGVEGARRAVDGGLRVAAEELVLGAEKEAARAGVAASARAAPELVIDAAAAVAIEAEDAQASERAHCVRLSTLGATEQDVRPAAGDLGRDGDRATRSGARDERCLPRVVLRCQPLVRQAGRLELP